MIGGSRESREREAGGVIWFDCLDKAGFVDRAGTGRATPCAARGANGAKGMGVGQARQGVAGQPGASLAVTVSLPCKPPTG